MTYPCVYGECTGVPQESVLNLLLWNLTYDVVLLTAVSHGYNGSHGWEEVCPRVNLTVACVIRFIRALGLRMIPQKTEAVFLHDGSKGEPPEATIRVKDTLVHVGGYTKYLGRYVDSQWSFKEHFARLALCLDGVAARLERLLPNMAKPGGRVRLHRGSSVHRVLRGLYMDSLMTSRLSLRIIRRSQRRMIIRLCRGYRTVSAAVLAGVSHLEHVARARTRVFLRLRELQAGGMKEQDNLQAAGRQLKNQARRLVIAECQGALARSKIDVRSVEAIGLCLPDWLRRE